jgi:uncharacterized membrane protein
MHLALNHIPVVGLPIVTLFLAVGWWRRREEVTRCALWALVLLSIAAIAIKFTGDFAAEQSAQRLAGAQEFVAKHEQIGDQATTGVFLLGISAALTLFLSRRSRPLRRWTIAAVLALGIAAALLYVRTANSGGKIGHPELRGQP